MSDLPSVARGHAPRVCWPGGLLVVLAAVCGSACAAERVAPDASAIEQARAGKPPIARAVWWGFDSEDSTASLQAAINSGAAQVIVEDMKAPWGVGPIVVKPHWPLDIKADDLPSCPDRETGERQRAPRCRSAAR